MALMLAFNFTVQVVAAFVVFVLGYLALFGSLLVCLAVAIGLYKSVKRVLAFMARSSSADNSIPSDAETLVHREKSFVIPTWKQRLVEAAVGGVKN
jgi:hypothetical protein